MRPVNGQNSPIAVKPGIRPDVVTPPELTAQTENVARPDSISQRELDTILHYPLLESESINLAHETTMSQPIHVIETWLPVDAPAPI